MVFYNSVECKNNLKKKLHTTFNDGNYKLTKPPVLKFEDDFINIFNVDGVKTITLNGEDY